MKKHKYVTPEISIIKIEIEDAILALSSSGADLTEFEYGGNLW